MQIQCPTCAQMLEVPDGSAGQVVACPSCKGQMQVPDQSAAAAVELLPAGQPAAAPEPTKKCPFCGETVLQAAKKCKHCKENIPEGADSEAVRARLAAKEKKLAEQLAAGGAPPIPWSVGGKIRTITITMAGALTFSVVLMVIGFSGRSDGREALGVFGILFAILFSICFLVTFSNDVTIPSSSNRTTPEKGLKAFLKSACGGRYAYAYACLLDGDKDGLERKRRPIAAAAVMEGCCSFNNLKGFKQYWSGLARSSGSHQRRAGCSGFKLQRIEGDYALVTATMKLDTYPAALLYLAPLALLPMAIVIMVVIALKRQTIPVSKLLRKVGDQWYVVNGELDSPEDRALEVAVAAAGPGAMAAGGLRTP